MNKKDFEILENADDDTVQKLEAQYPVFDEKKREEIYKMTMKKMKEQNEITYTEYSEKIEGVEKYKRPVWQRVTAVAAAAAIVAGGAVLFRNISREGKNKNSDYMTEVATDTTDTTTTENSTELLNYEEYIELMQPQADSAATALYNAANAALTEMNEEKELNELCIISSDESNNYNVSIDFDTDSFYDKLHYYFNNEEFYTDYDYFIFVQGYNCIYTVCEKKKFDDIYDFPSDPRNNTDDIDTGLVATYPRESVPAIISEKSYDMTDISDLMETPTSPRPSINELMTICQQLIQNPTILPRPITDDGSYVDEKEIHGLSQIYEGEDYQEYADIAVDFIDKYEDMRNIIDYGTSYDENDEINFNVVPSEEEIQYMEEIAYMNEATQNDDADEQKIYNDMVTYYEDINYGKYNRSTDERFNDIDDIKEYALSIISEDYFNEAFADTLTDKLAGANDGDTVTSDKCTFFTMYDGKLYVQNRIPAKGNLFDHWTNTPIKIYDVTETSFQAVREWSMFNPEYEAAITDPEELGSGHIINIYIFRKDPLTGEWRIDKP
ncbi:MAG: hypothetical protein IKK91_10775 [Ruminococcus sp.]|nr:hypothetical protein [Ruminococcus sp.]